MRHITKTTAVLMILAMGLSIPAMGGGAVWHFDGEEYRPGDIAESATSVSWGHNGSLGRPENGPFLIYLAPQEATTPVWPGGSDVAMLVGIVDIRLGPFAAEDGESYGPHHAIARFEIPAIPAGTYQIFHCNDPCTHTLGDIIGGWDLEVVEGPDGRPPSEIAEEVEKALVVYPTWPEDDTVSQQEALEGSGPPVAEPSTDLLVPPQRSVALSASPVAELDSLAAPGPVQIVGSDGADASLHPPTSIVLFLLAAFLLVPLAGAATTLARRHTSTGEQS